MTYLGTLFGGVLDTSQPIWGAPQGPGGPKGAPNRGDFRILARLTPGNGLKVVVSKPKQIEKVLRSILVASLGHSDFLFWLQTVSKHGVKFFSRRDRRKCIKEASDNKK